MTFSAGSAVDITTNPRFDLFEQHGMGVPENATFLGTERGAFAFANYTGDTVDIHMAGERGWCTRKLLRLMWAYVWDQLGCTRLTVYVREDRAEALAIDLRVGFQIEGYMRQADSGLGVWVLGMLRGDCSYGKKSTEGRQSRPEHAAEQAGAVQPGQHD